MTSYLASVLVREQRQRYDEKNENQGYSKIGAGVILGSVIYGASGISGKQGKIPKASLALP